MGLSLVSFWSGCLACWAIARWQQAEYHATSLHVDLKVSGGASHVAAGNRAGDWPQWGGSSIRNNTPVGKNIPAEWDIGEFDRETGAWKPDSADKVMWASRLGSQSYGNPVVANGQIYVGTNNGAGYLPRFPDTEDLGCLLAFSAADGKFLWQHSSEKLPSGRVHDWPLQGICCAPLIEGDRLWFVTSRGEVICLDTLGFYDDEDDGPRQAGWANLFRTTPDAAASFAQLELSPAVAALLSQAGVSLAGRVRVDATDDHGSSWDLTIRSQGRQPAETYRVVRDSNSLQIFRTAANGQPGEMIAQGPCDLTNGLDQGALNPTLQALLAARGMTVQDVVGVTAKAPGKQWLVQVNSADVRDLEIRREGPNLAAYKKITTLDREEADEVWVLDMMAELGVSQHNMCSCSVTSFGDLLFVHTANGVDESHIVIPNIDAPSFIAVDKHTGEVVWTDGSPGANIVHGQWSSPAVAEIDGVPQAIFPGGDGWVYSFRADRGKDGRPELLWRFDANPKTSKWELGGRGTRNNLIGTPVVLDQRVFIAVGQDPEHGEGQGHLWCIDPTKRGDISPQLAVRVEDRTQIVPHRRLQAVNEEDGEIAIDNPNSGAIWHYAGHDQNGDGKLDFEETMHRTCGTVAIKDNLLYIADFSGLFHCLDAQTGKLHWTYDMLSAAWGSALIVDNKVYIGDEDGELSVFRLTAEPHEPIAVNDMRNSVYSTPIVAHNVLYISNRTHLFAIEAAE